MITHHERRNRHVIRYFACPNDMEGNDDTWPFDKPHYLLLNLAYGGSWGGSKGVDTSLLPLEFVIDYVRYYKKP